MVIFKIKLFGALKHKMQSAEIEIQHENNDLLLPELQEAVKQQYPQLKEVDNYKLAVNNTIFDNEKNPIVNTDEIALLPPYAGG